MAEIIVALNKVHLVTLSEIQSTCVT